MNYDEKIKVDWNKYDKNANILLLGKTGSGKSSLINTIFSKYIARVSNTNPETSKLKIYNGRNYGVKVNLIDSRGYELSLDVNKNGFEHYKDEILKEIKDFEIKNNKIHIVWFCISIAGMRIEETDIEILKEFYFNSDLRDRLYVVLTKCDEDDKDGSISKKFKEIIKKNVSKNIEIFETSNDKELNKELEIGELIKYSADCISDEEVRQNFIGSQMINLDLKRREIKKIILYYSVGAFVIGATPIPIADAPVLITVQSAMAIQIFKTYGLECLVGISAGVTGDVIISQLGKFIAGAILKCIPGVGTVIGGGVNGGVSSTITYTMGSIIDEICNSDCKKILNGEDINLEESFSKEIIKNMFNSRYEQNNSTFNIHNYENKINNFDKDEYLNKLNGDY